MKFLIIGAGGVGGAVGAYLAKAGYDVDFIARGAHLAAMKESGLRVKSMTLGEFLIEKPNAYSMEEYQGKPDVVFVCVKGYSFADAATLLDRIATKETIIIPLLNVVTTGSSLRERLPHLHIIDGCIYIFSKVGNPGEIVQFGKVFKIVYGEPDGTVPAVLNEIAAALEESDIHVQVSDNIRRDAFQKLAIVSPLAAAGAYHNAPAGVIRETPAILEDYLALSEEMIALSKAMGIEFTTDVVDNNLKNIKTASADTTASMHRDIVKGGESEVDGLVFDVVRLGRKYGVATPVYEKIARHFGFSE